MSEALARLKLLKSTAYLNETGTQADAELKAVLKSASDMVSLYCGQTLTRATHEEERTGDDTNRLYLFHTPIISIVWVKLWDGISTFDTETATYYKIIAGEYLQYPYLGQETGAKWSRWYSDYENGIQVKYVGGYDSNDWDNKTVSEAFGVPSDLEHAVCQIAMKIWMDSKSGGGRFGMTSMSRDGGATFDKFINGIPDDTKMIINQYRRNWI